MHSRWPIGDRTKASCDTNLANLEVDYAQFLLPLKHL